MLEQFDILCFDIQDVGARFYTYLYALSFAMEECAGAGKAVVVLDRINPLGGELIQGTVLVLPTAGDPAAFDDETRGQIAMDTIRALQPFAEICVTRAGCTVSSHCGPDTIGVLYIRK